MYSLRNAYLVKIGLQEVDLFTLFQKPWPVLFLLVFLPQHKLHIPRGMIRLAVLDVDLTKELQLDVVGGLLSLGVASES